MGAHYLEFVPDIINWFIGLLSPLQWDAWRNWLATGGGLVALFVAVNTYRRNGTHKREEQARLVYTRISNIVFHKAGDEFGMLNHDAQVGTVDQSVQIVNPGESIRPYHRAVAPTIRATVVVHNGSKN